MTQACLQVSLPYAQIVASASASASAVSASVIKHDREEDGEEDDECSDTDFSVTILSTMDNASSLSSLSSSSSSFSFSSSSSSSSFSLLSMEDDEEEEDHDVRPNELRESYRDLYRGGGCRVGGIYPPSSPKDVRFFGEEEEEDSVASFYDDFGGIYDCWVDRGNGGTSMASSLSDNDNGGVFRTYDRVLHADRFSGSDHLNNKFHDRPCFGGHHSHGIEEYISPLCHSGTQDTEFMRYYADTDTDTDVADDTDTTTNDRSSSSHHDHSLPTSDVETLWLQDRQRERERNKTNVSVLAYRYAMAHILRIQDNVEQEQLEEQVGIVIEMKALACREAVGVANRWKKVRFCKRKGVECCAFGRGGRPVEVMGNNGGRR